MSPVEILFIAKMLSDNNVLLYSLSPCGRVQVITVTTPIGTHITVIVGGDFDGMKLSALTYKSAKKNQRRFTVLCEID